MNGIATQSLEGEEKIQSEFVRILEILVGAGGELETQDPGL